MSGLRGCAAASGRPVGLLRGGRQTGGSRGPGPAVLVLQRWPGRFDIRPGAPSSIATGVGAQNGMSPGPMYSLTFACAVAMMTSSAVDPIRTGILPGGRHVAIDMTCQCGKQFTVNDKV